MEIGKPFFGRLLVGATPGGATTTKSTAATKLELPLLSLGLFEQPQHARQFHFAGGFIGVEQTFDFPQRVEPFLKQFQSQGVLGDFQRYRLQLLIELLDTGARAAFEQFLLAHRQADLRLGQFRFGRAHVRHTTKTPSGVNPYEQWK